jgi:chorismate synthase
MATTLPVAAPASVLLRHLKSDHDYAECVRLQRETWGESFREIVPAAILKVSQRVGGITAGAFDPQSRMIGFVFGLTGYQGGRAMHWSHMLAVSPPYRDQGIGRKLKEFQRAELASAGVQSIWWTFDPLMARNAHLNLNRLGVDVVEYVPDMYASTGSDLHAIGTDRLIVCSDLTRVTGADTRAFAPVVIVNPEGKALDEFPAAPLVGIEVPTDINAIQRVSLDLAIGWRKQTRAAFLHYLGVGYHVAGFRREADNRTYYLLEQNH